MLKKYLQLAGLGFWETGDPIRPAAKTIGVPNDALVKHRKKRKRLNQIARKSRAVNRH